MISYDINENIKWIEPSTWEQPPISHSVESRGNDDVYEGEGGGYVWLAASVQPAKEK